MNTNNNETLIKNITEKNIYYRNLITNRENSDFDYKNKGETNRNY